MTRSLSGLMLAVIATAAGVGWLYLLRRSGALNVGPRVGEALPLQRLARGASQPLARIVVVWLTTGVAAGFALRAVAGWRRGARAAVVFVCCAVILLAAGAAADAITANETVRSHLAEQPGRTATWLAAGLMALGAATP